MFLISNAVKAQEYNCFALDDDSHGASKFCAGVPEMFSLTRQCYRWRKLFWCLAVVSLRSDVNGSFIDCLTLCCNLLTRCSRFSAELLNIHTSKSAEQRGMVETAKWNWWGSLKATGAGDTHAHYRTCNKTFISKKPILHQYTSSTCMNM